MPYGWDICCNILLAVLLPPVSVALRFGCGSMKLLTCLLLTILGYVPGIIYALSEVVFGDRDRFVNTEQTGPMLPPERYARAL